jgi:tyrosinase
MYEKALRNECGYTGGQPYWDWSLDVSSTNSSSMAVYSNPVFDPITGFGGNGPYLDATAEQNVFGLTGRTGGGCVQDGPFTNSSFMVNYPGPPVCLTRDFIPTIMNTFAQQSLVDGVLSQPDYTTFAKAIENVPDFNYPNIHGSGHFGVGGVLGTIGDAYNSPGGMMEYLMLQLILR